MQVYVVEAGNLFFDWRLERFVGNLNVNCFLPSKKLAIELQQSKFSGAPNVLEFGIDEVNVYGGTLIKEGGDYFAP